MCVHVSPCLKPNNSKTAGEILMILGMVICVNKEIFTIKILGANSKHGGSDCQMQTG